MRGAVVADLAVDAIIGDDATHRVIGPAADGEHEGLVTALGRLRAEGAEHVGLAWPAELNAAAFEAGEAVIAGPHGWVPRREGAVVFWHAYAARPRQLTDVGEADRRLRLAMVHTADRLAALDVARWRPDVADELTDLRTFGRLDSPPGTPPRCVELAARALQAAGIVDLALDDDGAAITHAEAEGRRTALRDLATAARHALVAACSPEVWPPE